MPGRIIALVLALSLGMPVAGMSGSGVTSRWAARDVTIDGVADEWDTVTRFAEKSPFMVGVVNDRNFLYLMLSTSDPAARMQVLRGGLIVWFDAKGTRAKRFGVRYPVVQLPEVNGEGPARGRPGGGMPRGPRNGGGLPGALEIDENDPQWKQIEIIGPEKDDRRSLVLDEVPGIRLKMTQVEGTLVYELRVPLHSNVEQPYAIGAQAGAIVGIGLETLRPEGGPRRPGGMGGPGGRGPGGGMRRPGGMGGRGGMDGPRRAGRPQIKPLKEWTTVQLATRAT